MRRRIVRFEHGGDAYHLNPWVSAFDHDTVYFPTTNCSGPRFAQAFLFSSADLLYGERPRMVSAPARGCVWTVEDRQSCLSLAKRS